jgi:hypothetical protein
MVETITTEGLLENFRKILGAFTCVINECAPYNAEQQKFLLFTNKIIQNCASSQLLAAYACYGDAKILIRSSFETLVLMAYIAKYPEKFEEYKADHEISEFKWHMYLVRIGKRDFHGFCRHYYENLSEKAKVKLKVKGSPEVHKKNPIQFFRKVEDVFQDFRAWKPLSQQIYNLSKDLKKSNFLDFGNMRDFDALLYDMNSQIAHGSLGTVVSEYAIEPDNDEAHEKLKDCFRQIVLILMTLQKIFAFVLNKEIPYSWANPTVEMFEYLGFDLTPYKKQPEPAKSIAQDPSSFLYLPLQDPYTLKV